MCGGPNVVANVYMADGVDTYVVHCCVHKELCCVRDEFRKNMLLLLQKKNDLRDGEILRGELQLQLYEHQVELPMCHNGKALR